MNKTFIIGEMAGCHDGDLSKARDLVNIAAGNGCSAVKTQWCSNIDKMAERRKIDPPSVYRLLSFPEGWHADLRWLAKSLCMEYIVSVFIPEDIKVVAEHADQIKVASLEASDYQLVKACIDTGKPVIISTGCMDHAEVNKLFFKLISMQANKEKTFMLHSVSSYPVPIGESNLSCLPIFHGYSDQTGRLVTGALAVMAGARILEVHFRSESTDRSNPDYPHSLNPAGLGEYVRLVRLAEKEKGDGIKIVQPSELPLRKHRVIVP